MYHVQLFNKNKGFFLQFLRLPFNCVGFFPLRPIICALVHFVPAGFWWLLFYPVEKTKHTHLLRMELLHLPFRCSTAIIQSLLNVSICKDRVMRRKSRETKQKIIIKNYTLFELSDTYACMYKYSTREKNNELNEEVETIEHCFIFFCLFVWDFFFGIWLHVNFFFLQAAEPCF